MKKRQKAKPNRKPQRASTAALGATRPAGTATLAGNKTRHSYARDVAIRFGDEPSARDLAARPAGLWYASLGAEQRAVNAGSKSVSAAALDGDDPAYLGLLLLPVLLLAGLLATGQSMRMPYRIPLPDVPSVASRPINGPPAAIAPVIIARPVDPMAALNLPRLAMQARPPVADVQPWSRIVVYAPRVPRSAEPLGLPVVRYAPMPPSDVTPWDGTARGLRLALSPPLALQPIVPAPSVVAPMPAPFANGTPVGTPGIVTGLCRPAARTAVLPSNSPVATQPSPEQFGLQLAAAAKTQIGTFTVYSARYRKIAFPGGDVPDFYGACSDVIIRAYRQLGIDLQVLVAEARIGGGDTNIAHRRTESIRALFARDGASLPITSFPEDYRPGDVVTYLRPFSRVSRAHIAIVSDVMGPNRRPLIIHNRGWGPQLEDALFVDHITGHYRFSGVSRRSSPTQIASVRSLRKAAAGLLATRGRTTF